MPALRQLPPPQGIEAMQRINVAIVNPIFLSVFLGAALGCVVTIVLALMDTSKPGAFLAIAGAAIYLIGSLLLTAVFHIPRNNALAALFASAPGSAVIWVRYVAEWTLWNHVRGLAALVATALLAIGLR